MTKDQCLGLCSFVLRFQNITPYNSHALIALSNLAGSLHEPLGKAECEPAHKEWLDMVRQVKTMDAVYDAREKAAGSGDASEIERAVAVSVLSNEG